jgi:1,4-dihydroxy-6-naphthoate synthase
VTFQQAGLRQLVDVGTWWQETRSLPLPLGVNAVKRDLDARFGSGALAECVATLHRSLAYALEHRDESVAYTMPYAALNARNAGTQPPSREIVEKYLGLYVTGLTTDMGDAGRAALRRFYDEGAAAGLCPRMDRVDVM